MHDFFLLQWKKPLESRRSQLSNKKNACQKFLFWLSYDCSKLKFSEGPKNANFSVAESRVPNDVRVAHLAFLGEIAKHIV